jgi:hypothetical protein
MTKAKRTRRKTTAHARSNAVTGTSRTEARKTAIPARSAQARIKTVSAIADKEPAAPDLFFPKRGAQPHFGA